MVRFDRNPYASRVFVYECSRCKGMRPEPFIPCQVKLWAGIMTDLTLCPADGAYDAKFEEVGE